MEAKLVDILWLDISYVNLLIGYILHFLPGESFFFQQLLSLEMVNLLFPERGHDLQVRNSAWKNCQNRSQTVSFVENIHRIDFVDLVDDDAEQPNALSTNVVVFGVVDGRADDLAVHSLWTENVLDHGRR